jgi:hypothetical protein
MPNGICLDENIQAPKPEAGDQADQGTQALADPRSRRSIACGLATPLAPPVRPRAALRARKSDHGGVLLRIQDQQSEERDVCVLLSTCREPTMRPGCVEIELRWGGQAGLTVFFPPLRMTVRLAADAEKRSIAVDRYRHLQDQLSHRFLLVPSDRRTGQVGPFRQPSVGKKAIPIRRCAPMPRRHRAGAIWASSRRARASRSRQITDLTSPKNVRCVGNGSRRPS